MAPHKTITVNGRVYDAVTGLPIESTASTPKKAQSSSKPSAQTPSPKAPRPAATPRPDFVKVSAKKARPTATTTDKKAPSTPRSTTSAKAVHGSPQRSQTLNRRAAKKPAPVQRPHTRRNTPGRNLHTATHADVARFAKHPDTSTANTAKQAGPTEKDTPPQNHPVVDRALRRRQAKKEVATATAKQTKETEITKALAAPKPKTQKKHSDDRKRRIRRSIITISVIVAILLAFFAVYRLVPSISVNFAAARAGISASYPEYTPDGYHLSQPVSFSEGEVVLKFDSNSNDNYYTVTQTRSSWDSTAVLDSVVTPAAGADYVTTKERGLTIYTYDSSAVWVNGGILYQIDSQAPLSGDQIRRIATSL